MLVHSFAENGQPDDGTMLRLPRLATVVNSSAIVNASGVGGVVCDAGDCAALASFSLCLWVNVLLKMPASVVISYYISVYVHNALLIRLEDRYISAGYMNRQLHGSEMLVSPRAWHLLCLVRRGNTTTFYLDHSLLIHLNSPMPLLLNGSLVLGNDQDQLDAGYTPTEAFVGEMAWLGLWDYAFTSHDLAALLRCRPARHPSITGTLLPWEVRGQVTTLDKDPCQERDTPISMMVPALVPYTNARDFCRKLGMSLPVPKSVEASRRIFTALKAPDAERCASLYSVIAMLWLGAEYSSATHRWIDGSSGADLDYVSPHLSSSGGTSPRAVVIKSGIWISTQDDERHCFTCEGVLRGGPFLLRGLCRMPLYLYVRTSPSGGIYWQGVARVSLLQRGDVWQLQDDLHGQVMAQLKVRGLPLGRAIWLIGNTSVCTDSIALPSTATSLFFTQCNKGLFSCWTGGCVPMEKRCSRTPECQDSSDERGCQLVHPRPGTRFHLPPRSNTFTLDISLWFWKVSLAGKDTGTGVLRVLVGGFLKWRDNRLTFHNLQRETALNVVDPTLPVWQPFLQVVDEARLAGSVPQLRKVLVSRDAEGTDTGFDVVFEGSNNRLELMVEIAAHVSCSFSLSRFPFDEQKCNVTFLLTNLPQQYAHYQSQAVVQVCPQNTTMTEFEVHDCALHLQNGSSVVRLSMRLRRRWSYHLWATYIPTVLLHIVGYGTMTVPAQDIQSRVMLSLLALLTLVSLYSDTLATLPSCSYLRLLDAWLLFSVAFPAAVIAVHMTSSDPDKSTAHFVLWRGKVLLGVLYSIFVCAYFVVLVATG